MRLTEEFFWKCTPRQIHKLIKRKAEVDNRAEIRSDLRAGIIAATIINAQRTDKDQPILSASDFFPELAEMAAKSAPGGGRVTVAARKKRGEELAEKAKAAFAIFGGSWTYSIDNPEQEQVTEE